jgi:hypothetical protein
MIHFIHLLILWNKVSWISACNFFFFFGIHDWFVNLFIGEAASFTLA